MDHLQSRGLRASIKVCKACQVMEGGVDARWPVDDDDEGDEGDGDGLDTNRDVDDDDDDDGGCISPARDSCSGCPPSPPPCPYPYFPAALISRMVSTLRVDETPSSIRGSLSTYVRTSNAAWTGGTRADMSPSTYTFSRSAFIPHTEPPTILLNCTNTSVIHTTHRFQGEKHR